MGELKFSVVFHTPFIPNSGTGHEGRDVSIADDPTDTERLKGIARDIASAELGVSDRRCKEIFGSEGKGGSWAWDMHLPEGAHWKRSTHDRIEIDDQTGSAKKGAKLLTEMIWTEKAILTLSPRHARSTPVEDELLLRVVLRAVKHVGMMRRRGFGLITCHDENELSLDEVNKFLKEVRA